MADKKSKPAATKGGQKAVSIPTRPKKPDPYAKMRKHMTHLPEDPITKRNPLAGVEFVNLKVTKLSVIRLLGLSESSIPRLEARGTMVLHPEGHPIAGHVDVLTTVRRYCNELRERARDMGQEVIPVVSDEEVNAEQDYRKQKARMARLQADKYEGALVDARAVEAERVSEISRAKARLLGLSAAIVAEVAPFLATVEGGAELIESVRERAEAKVEETLIELSRDDEGESGLEEFQEDDDGVSTGE